MEEINKNVKKVILLMIFLTSFISGYFLNEYYPYNTLYSKVDINTKIDKNKGDLDLTFFWEVYNKVKKEYFSINDIKKEDIVS
jgi:hypothetical protein